MTASLPALSAGGVPAAILAVLVMMVVVLDQVRYLIIHVYLFLVMVQSRALEIAPPLRSLDLEPAGLAEHARLILDHRASFRRLWRAPIGGGRPRHAVLPLSALLSITCMKFLQISIDLALLQLFLRTLILKSILPCL